MKVECIRESVRNALMSLERVTGKNLSLPILSGVHISASKKNNTISLQATNLDLGMEISLPAKIEEEGDIIVPPGVVIGILSGVFDKKIEMAVAQGNLSLSSVNTSSLVKGIQGEEFPTLPVVQGGVELTLPSKTLVEGVKSVWYSASLSDIKPEISSVHISIQNDIVVFVSTDSFRLAEKKINASRVNEEAELLLPYKNITEIMRIFEGVSGEVKILCNKNQASFFAGGTYVTSRVIDGIFPDYNQIIPKNHQTSVTALKQDFMNILKVANIFADKSNRIEIIADPKEKLFEIRSHNANIGENTSRIDATLEGEKISLGFNHKYLLDCLPSIKQESIVLHFAGQGKPLILQGKGDKSFLYLVMPLTPQ